MAIALPSLNILVVDDEASIRASLREILEFEGYRVEVAKDGKEGFDMLAKQSFDIVLCDIRMPRMDGLELLTAALGVKPELRFIMISAHGNIETAVDATKKGAFDFLSKPFDLNRLLVTVRNAADQFSLLQQTRMLKQKVQQGNAQADDMIGNAPSLNFVRNTIAKVAPTEARVLITGPNGSGKELVANSIHRQSERKNAPLVVVNCAAIPSELIESELFGHEKGSFTSAVRQHIGKFEQAHNGTLFLDEIGDMSLNAQAKVLRALQDSRISRVGGDKQIDVNVRILAATNKNLVQEIAAGRFREDLYHRLSVIIIQVPALNDRREDIPLLVARFLQDIAMGNGALPATINADALEYLKKLDWTGNIRELHNVVERLVIMGGNNITLKIAKTFAGK